ncbi:MAG: alpha/beta fold hydrolase [Phycisphaerales bacterium]
MTTTPTPSLPLDERPGQRLTLRGLEEVDVPVRISQRGNGPDVVFLHGLVGLNDHWELVIDRVMDVVRSTALEVPLLSLTGDDCSIDGVTKLTAEFLSRHLGRPCVLVGNSFGGHVALKIAIEYPHLCSGLVLAGASGLIEKSMVADVQSRPTRPWLEKKIGELFFDRSKMAQSDVDRAFGELNDRPKARAMVKLSRSARRNHLGDEIHRIKVPTLVVWGRQDIVTPPEAAHEFAAKISGSKLVWFDRCGHAPMIESPDEFARELGGFVTGIGAGRS